jgi:lysophospholipase L1-like esterase
MNGEMPYGLNPKVWWVHIGINDLSLKGCSEEVVLLGILRVVEEIQNARPNDIIVINSLLPVQRNEDGLLEHTGKHHEHKALNNKEKNLDDSEMSSKRMHIDLWPSIVSINEELSKFASKHPGIKFFDADQVFVEERDGDKYLKLDLMQDTVHPNLSGHKKWNGAIKKRLHSILDGKE